jgi:hypothetical protein
MEAALLGVPYTGRMPDFSQRARDEAAAALPPELMVRTGRALLSAGAAACRRMGTVACALWRAGWCVGRGGGTGVGRGGVRVPSVACRVAFQPGFRSTASCAMTRTRRTRSRWRRTGAATGWLTG